MSKKRNAARRLGCRRVRRWLQEQHDWDAAAAVGPASAAGAASAAEVHLQECPACRRFREFLAGYGRELAASLDALYAERPGGAGLELAAGHAAAPPAAPAAPDRPAPVRWARRPVARWAVPAAAALLALAAGTQVPRLVAGARVERRIRQEVTALVEAVYSRPVAQGVETALAGGSLIEELEELEALEELEELEGLAEGDGLQGLGEGEDFLVQ
jgi:hypothetical protein